MIPNAATPTITTAKGPSVFLFIDPQKIRGGTTGIIENSTQKAQVESQRASPENRQMSFDPPEQFIVLKGFLKRS